MKRLYEKNKLTFALIWIGVYVVAASVADGLSGAIGVAKIVTTPLLESSRRWLLVFCSP